MIDSFTNFTTQTSNVTDPKESTRTQELLPSMAIRAFMLFIRNKHVNIYL